MFWLLFQSVFLVNIVDGFVDMSQAINPSIGSLSLKKVYKMGISEKWNDFVFKSGLWDDILFRLKEKYATSSESLMMLESLTLVILNISIIFNGKLNQIYTESMFILLLDLFTNSLPSDLPGQIQLKGYLTRIQLNILIIFNFLISNQHTSIKDFMKFVGFEQFHVCLIKQMDSQIETLQFNNEFLLQALSFISKIPCITKSSGKQAEIILKLSTEDNKINSSAIKVLLKILIQKGAETCQDQSNFLSSMKDYVDKSKIVPLYTKKYFQYQLNQDETKVLSVLYALFEKKTFVMELFAKRFVAICKSCVTSSPGHEKFIDDGIILISSFAYKSQEKVFYANKKQPSSLFDLFSTWLNASNMDRKSSVLLCILNLVNNSPENQNLILEQQGPQSIIKILLDFTHPKLFTKSLEILQILALNQKLGSYFQKHSIMPILTTLLKKYISLNKPNRIVQILKLFINFGHAKTSLKGILISQDLTDLLCETFVSTNHSVIKYTIILSRKLMSLEKAFFITEPIFNGLKRALGIIETREESLKFCWCLIFDYEKVIVFNKGKFMMREHGVLELLMDMKKEILGQERIILDVVLKLLEKD